jgi:FMN phosphatase YigB (HAD superfamily)
MMLPLFRKSAPKEIDLESVQAVLFDLDGTLVDVDMNRFVPAYLRRLTEQMAEQVEPIQATHVLHQAVAEMFANRDPQRTLENILYDVLHEELGVTSQDYRASLEQFCREDLDSLESLVTGHPLSRQLVDVSLQRGWQVALATNPIFPRAVVDARLNWGALDVDSFHHITSYENAHFCKPNPGYFEELLAELEVPAHACLMIGNDVLHDLSASQVGIRTCLLTPWCIKRSGVSFKPDWKGDHEDLLKFFAR